MELVQFDRLKAQIKTASPYQILALEPLIDLAISGQFVEMALARRTEKTVQTRKCPHCSSNNVVLHGRDQNKRQRFNCRGCRRTYNIMTGTSMARARKPEKWNRYLACMTEHLSVRTIVKTGIDINQVTAWRWRHRFLLAAANDNAAILTGVIQANATLLPWSFKGSRDWKRGKPPADRAASSRGLGAAMLGLSGADVPVLTALDSGLSVFDAVLDSLSDIEETLTAARAMPMSPIKQMRYIIMSLIQQR
jgi:transposase-like protein